MALFKFGQRRVTDPLAQQNFEQLEGVFPLKRESIATGAVILDTQRVLGNNTTAPFKASAPGTTDQHPLPRGAGGVMQLTYTPPVDAWWETVGNVMVERTAPSWQITHPSLFLSPVDADGIGLARAAIPSHNAFLYSAQTVPALWALEAGVTYTLDLGIYFADLSYFYWQMPEYLRLYGKAWAR